jgi:hypothetical protein
MTVDQLLDTMSVEEFHGWMAYYQLEPFGCLVEDQRHEAHLQLHYAINSKPGAEIPRFLDRDPKRTEEKEAERLAREEKELMVFFANVEAQQRLRAKKQEEPPKPKKTRKPRTSKGAAK